MSDPLLPSPTHVTTYEDLLAQDDKILAQAAEAAADDTPEALWPPGWRMTTGFLLAVSLLAGCGADPASKPAPMTSAPTTHARARAQALDPASLAHPVSPADCTLAQCQGAGALVRYYRAYSPGFSQAASVLVAPGNTVLFQADRPCVWAGQTTTSDDGREASWFCSPSASPVTLLAVASSNG